MEANDISHNKDTVVAGTLKVALGTTLTVALYFGCELLIGYIGLEQMLIGAGLIIACILVNIIMELISNHFS